MNAPVTLEHLLAQYDVAKAEADRAVAVLEQVKEAIVAQLPSQIEGTTSAKIGDAKVTVTYKQNRRVDTGALQQQWDTLSNNAQKCFTWKADVCLKDMRAAQNMDAKAYAEAARFITTTPAKPALKIERN